MFTAKSTLIDDIYLCNKKFTVYTVYTVQIFPVITI
jgi:hypothetical protein